MNPQAILFKGTVECDILPFSLTTIGHVIDPMCSRNMPKVMI